MSVRRAALAERHTATRGTNSKSVWRAFAPTGMWDRAIVSNGPAVERFNAARCDALLRRFSAGRVITPADAF